MYSLLKLFAILFRDNVLSKSKVSYFLENLATPRCLIEKLRVETAPAPEK